MSEFDPNRGYRNLLIALNREVCRIEDRVAEMSNIEHPLIRRQNKLRNAHIGGLKFLLAKNKKAQQYYFKTNDPRRIAKELMTTDAPCPTLPHS